MMSGKPGKTGFHFPDHALNVAPCHFISSSLPSAASSVKELKGWVAERMQTAKKKGLPLHHIHITRMTPKRVEEVLAGGSLYWVIRGEIAAREKIIGDRAVP